MKTRALAAGLLLWALSTCVALAQSRPWEEYSKLINSSEAVGTMGPELFGDQVNYYTGGLSFSATDISLSGNNKLPVTLSRTLAVSGRQRGYAPSESFGDWELDVPRISGVYAKEWINSSGTAQRCSVASAGAAMPPSLWLYQPGVPPTYFAPEDYWHGLQMSLPGGGGGELLYVRAGVTKPSTGGPYYWLTSNFTYFSCLSTIKNGSGEGFLAITPDGTKYWFDWQAQYFEPPLKHSAGTSAQIDRRKNTLYATRVEDRFGNWVTYTYTNAYNAPARLSAITSSDGRQITVAYNAGGQIGSATDGSRTWTYLYPDAPRLTAVLLPDGSRWTFDLGFAGAYIHYNETPTGGVPSSCTDPGTGDPVLTSGTEPDPTCTNPGSPDATTTDPVRSCTDPGQVWLFQSTGTITHPSGAVGTFTVEPERFGRSNVPEICANVQTPINDPNDDVAYYPMAWDAVALTKKTVTGPGLLPATWTYSYLDGTEIAGPENQFTHYVFGTNFHGDEGQLLRVESGSGPTAVLKTETTTFENATSGQPYPTPIGTSPQPRNDAYTSENLRPQRSHSITQDGVTFSRTVTAYDSFARAISATQASSLGYSRDEATSYEDNAVSWVLGQVKTSSLAGKITTSNVYDPTTALLTNTSSFGLLQYSLAYYADGTLRTFTDPRNFTTTLSDWYRGRPRNIAYPNNTAQAAAVNGQGWLTAVTDELGTTTAYGYDALGRLSLVDYTNVDAVQWNDTTRSFLPVAGAEYGLPAGHWKQTVSTGNGQSTTFYDAQWRPVLTMSEDTANASSRSFVVNRYDAAGRMVFTSYPVGTLTSINDSLLGTTNVYDVLGRVIQVKQDSELGVLTSSTEYLPGFQTRTTNPRGFQTVTSYQTFDTPDSSHPVLIQAPEGATTTIVRDNFGKPQQVTRSGN